MMEHANAALARKLSAGKDSTGNSPRSILRALRLALARSAADKLNLPLTVIGVKQTICAQADMADVVPEGWMLLQFTHAASIAAVCIDPGCVSAIVQSLTIGEVTGDQPQPRPFTNTDAAMAVPLIEDLFPRAREMVEAPQDINSLPDYEFDMRADEARTLTLHLTNDSYRVFGLTVDLAEGARQGQITILLPECGDTEADPVAEALDVGNNLGQASGVMRAELHAMICRISLPLSSFSSLKPGDILPLTGARLDRTDVQTIDRVRAAIGRLGQCGGMRAVRINEQAGVTVETGQADQAFLESHTGLKDEEGPAAGVAIDPPNDSSAPDVIFPGDEDLTVLNSDQVAAEISQLAGLPDQNTDGGPTF